MPRRTLFRVGAALHELTQLPDFIPVFLRDTLPRSLNTKVWERKMSLGTILLIVLVLLLVGALPTWPYSGGWGYYPSGGLGLVLIILLVLVVSGRL
jgi:hypothetical protein